MSANTPNIDQLIHTLGCKHGDPVVAQLTLAMGNPTRRVVEELSFLDFPQLGVCFVLDKNGIVDVIHLFSQGKEGHDVFRGGLPGGIKFSGTREIVRSRLPEPMASGGGFVGILGDVVPHWDKFPIGLHTVTVQYAPNGEVDLVTLSR